nr:MAPK-interacting and spindle-stabilizing protein-like [Aegilops tauschii subsp. strangulata]
MPVPRAPAPGLLGPDPAGHQAFVGAPYQPYGAPLAPPPLGGYGAPAQALPYGGQLPPPAPAPWDPALLAALHSAPLPSNYGGGGEWYMDSGATAHMIAHPGSFGHGSFGSGPCAPYLARCAAAPPGGPPARRLLPPPPGFSTPSPEVESYRAPGSPAPSPEVEPAGTPPATPATGSTSPVASFAAGSAGTVAAPDAAAPAPHAAGAPIVAAAPAATGAPVVAVDPDAVVAPAAAAPAGPGADTAYLLLYVDDIILTASAPDLLQWLTARLRDEFALKDLGPLHYFLGIEVIRRADSFFLHQQKYAHELLERAVLDADSPRPAVRCSAGVPPYARPA